MITTKSIFIFVLAGLFEIAGGYLVWLWLKESKPAWYGVLGGLILALYGVVATWQNASFTKVYVVYGGIFIIISFLWGSLIDGFKPDKYDVIGGIITLLGVSIIYYYPRS
jgi:small multidrug resistance family-3 protein